MNRHRPTALLAALLAIVAARPAAGAPTAVDPPETVEKPRDRLAPEWDQVFAPDARLQRVAVGFGWAEGPLWSAKRKCLLFTDVPGDAIYEWCPSGRLRAVRSPSGHEGPVPAGISDAGANGLADDGAGGIVVARHGDRAIARWRDAGRLEAAPAVVADRFEGKRFNSPNDVVVGRKGDVFFTDPPYGLPKQLQDPGRELTFQGVFRARPHGGSWRTTLVTDALKWPNGIALSPDGHTLYASSSDADAPVVLAIALDREGAAAPRVLFDAAPYLRAKARRGGLDGMAVDAAGRLFVAGPGLVLVVDAAGKLLGTLATGEPTSSCKFGEDGSTLFVTTNRSLLRIPTKTRGATFRGR